MTAIPTSTHKDTQEKVSSCNACCCISTFVPILGLIALLIVFLVKFFDTDIDRYTAMKNLPNFKVGSEGSLNSLIITNTQLTAEFNITVSVDNPTSHSRVYYDAVSAEICYQGEGLVLTKSSLPSFTTHKRSVIHMTLSVNKPFDFGGAATSIAQSRKYGTVEFGLILSSKIKYKNNMAHSGWESLKVVCNPLKFGVSPNDFNTNTTNPGILLEGVTCTST
jgi:hypothetical protein